MLLTKKWLEHFSQLNKPIDEIVERLSLLGLEVDESTNLQSKYQGFIIAKIEEIKKHPNADKLNICTVNTGTKKQEVVCGAKNVRQGMYVVFADVGTTIPSTGSKLKPSKIRGIPSTGMLCSLEELELEEKSEGIIDLSEYLENCGITSTQISDELLGEEFSIISQLDDVIIDIDITPNRGDCTSVLGIAKTLASANLVSQPELNKPKYQVSSNNQTTDNEVLVTITEEAKQQCSSFSWRPIYGISQQSNIDAKIIDVLKTTSQNHQNNLVNISNYVNLGIGRPNHIYDLDKIDGNITIRLSKQAEQFTAIGGQEYTLPQGLTVVADEKKVLAIAGIIGGMESQVDENTTNILIEVATFDSEAVSSAGRTLNIHTDSRFRFERKVNNETRHYADEFITHHVLSSFGGKAAKRKEISTIDETPKTIQIDFTKIKNILGIEALTNELIIDILHKIGFKIEGDLATIPPHKAHDISITEDLAEEILILHGIENLTEKEFTIPAIAVTEKNTKTAKSSSLQSHSSIANKLGKIMQLRGYQEVITWAFHKPEDNKNFGIPESEELQIANPITDLLSKMRGTIIPNLLGIVSHNIHHGKDNFAIYEQGNVYTKTTHQRPVLAALKIGSYTNNNIHKEARPIDFFDIKADVLQLLGQQNVDFNTNEIPQYYHPGVAAAIKLGPKILGYVGKLHPSIVKKYGIKQKNIFALELFIDSISIKNKKLKPYNTSKYAKSPRDFAFILPNETRSADVVKSILKADSLVKSVEVFDQFLKDTTKSLAFKVVLQSNDRTLTEDDITNASSKIIEIVESKHLGKLRDGS